MTKKAGNKGNQMFFIFLVSFIFFWFIIGVSEVARVSNVYFNVTISLLFGISFYGTIISGINLFLK
jgi:hypothetical protein